MRAAPTSQVLCQECQRPLPGEPSSKPQKAPSRKFCDSSCAARYNNRKFPKRQPEGRCKTCQVPIPARRSYCARPCEQVAIRARSRTPETKRREGIQGVVTWRQRTKLRAVAYKGGRCQRCGYDRCIQALQFHHLDPNQKDFTISGKTMAWERIRDEIDKCVLLCANCHAELHAGLIDSSEFAAQQADSEFFPGNVAAANRDLSR